MDGHQEKSFFFVNEKCLDLHEDNPGHHCEVSKLG